MTIRILKDDGTWSVVSGGGSGGASGDVYFANILGVPSDNPQLATVLSKKVDIDDESTDTFAIGDGANGAYINTE